MLKEIPKLSLIVFGLGAVVIFALVLSIGVWSWQYQVRLDQFAAFSNFPPIPDKSQLPWVPGTPTQTIAPLNPCDQDKDGDCDEPDYNIAAKFVGECEDGGNFNVLADADGDGCISPSDLWQLYPDFRGYKYQGSPPQTFLSQAPCDIDWDGDCDGRDYRSLVNAVGRCLNQVGYERFADADRDDCVSDRDFQSILPTFPLSVRGVKAGDEVTVRGTVVENKILSPVDGPDVLSVTVGGEPLAVVYHYGEFPPCLNAKIGERVRSLGVGAEVEIFGKVVSPGELSTCDAERYSIKGF